MTYSCAFAPKEYDNRLRLWLSVVNAHPLAHFNSMVGGQAVVTHSYSNADCSHNFYAHVCFV